MEPASPNKRDYVEKPSFEKSKQEFIESVEITQQEFDEAYLFPLQKIITWDPSLYPQLEDTELHIVATKEAPKFPSAHVLYSYDQEHIYLWYIERNQFIDE
jgi:hypothetical protein